jgi:cellulose synthase/poly-beta-1,6-N-acetylglucosamine synthase-like glycosyltransferase
MCFNDIYTGLLCYFSIIIITGQFVFNVAYIENKTGIDYFFHISVELFYWYLSISFLYVIRNWKLPEVKKKLDELPIQQIKYPSIDILIPCYNENEELIKKTLQNAINIDYPKHIFNIYLLDDSKRDTLKLICEDLNIRYVTRTTNRNHKAGNLNDFLDIQINKTIIIDSINSIHNDNLSHSSKSNDSVAVNITPVNPLSPDIVRQKNEEKEDKNDSENISEIELKEGSVENSSDKTSNNSEDKVSDYICVLDCDMIPERNIFNILVPYLFEENPEKELNINQTIALVQPRQYFYNCNYDTDYFDMDNSIYVKIIMPAMSEMNNAPYIGTNALISRKALSDVGNFYEGHATEDTITSLLICSTREEKSNDFYRTKYAYPQKVAEGFAPETMAEAFDQRLRWIKGGVQLILNENPLCKSNLDCQQRFAWLITNSFWLFGIFFLGQYVTHLYALMEYIRGDPNNNIEDKIVYQFSFITQIISFFLLPEVTLLEKLRSIQMFVSYIPVYLYSFMSHLCGCLSISIVSNKGEQREFHILFIFHILVLCSIYGLSIYVLVMITLDIWGYLKVLSLMIIYAVLFYPVIKSLFKACWCC